MNSVRSDRGHRVVYVQMLNPLWLHKLQNTGFLVDYDLLIKKAEVGLHTSLATSP